VTTELQKGRYIYYRCSHGRGKCPLPYMREQDVAIRLGAVLKGISVPEGVADQIVGSLRSGVDRLERERQRSLAALHQRLAAVRTRMDQIYEDKLDGKISEEFWNRKHGECREQERLLQVQISRSGEPVTGEHVLTVQKVLNSPRARILCTLRGIPRSRGNC
jgi:site-specific DNA recombinase